jgi:hypothetical protein
VFGGLGRFLCWCRKNGLVEHHLCDDLDRDERPKPRKAGDNVPSLDELRCIWKAVENEPQRDLVRFLLLTPDRTICFALPAPRGSGKNGKLADGKKRKPLVG